MISAKHGVGLGDIIVYCRKKVELVKELERKKLEDLTSA